MKPVEQIRRENLQTLIGEHGSMAALARALEDISPAQLSQWKGAIAHSETGKPRAMGSASARRIEQKLGLELGWMDTDHSVDTSVAPAGAGVAAWEDEADIRANPAYVLIPHYDVRLSAGAGADAEWMAHTENDPITFRLGWFRHKGLNPEHCKGLYVRGDSMSPELQDGDTVLIDLAQSQVQDNEIYAILYHGELYIKRLFHLPGGGIKVKSDNPAYDPWDVRGEELEAFRVLGRKVWRGG